MTGIQPGTTKDLAVASATALLLFAATASCWTAVARADGPLAAKVKLTTLQSYKGSALPKPDKILVYDLVPGTDIQVDKSQKLRPRHLIAGDENPDAISRKSESTFSEELGKKLAKDRHSSATRHRRHRALRQLTCDSRNICGSPGRRQDPARDCWHDPRLGPGADEDRCPFEDFR